MGGKKNPEPKRIGPEDYPFLSIGFCGLPTVHEGKTADAQAGLLTLGSFYFPRLPIPGIRTVACGGVRPRLQRRARPVL